MYFIISSILESRVWHNTQENTTKDILSQLDSILLQKEKNKIPTQNKQTKMDSKLHVTL